MREWSHIAQDASIRHVGPMAQAFRAAFGLGEDPLRIGSMDADGVALSGGEGARGADAGAAGGVLNVEEPAADGACPSTLQMERAMRSGVISRT